MKISAKQVGKMIKQMRRFLTVILALGALAACQSNGSAGQVDTQGASTETARTGLGGEIDPDLAPESARSYTNVWEDETVRHRSIMFPHVVDGCDLVIDGQEDVFSAPEPGYKFDRMTEICRAPGVNGATRKLEIMRESLKEAPDYSRMENVEG